MSLPSKHPPVLQPSKRPQVLGPLLVFLLLSLACLVHPPLRPLAFFRWPWEQPHPLVHLDYASYRGTAATSQVNSFKGMRFAEPPTGPRRFRPAVFPPSRSTAGVVQEATRFGPSCPQQPARSHATPGGILGELLEALPRWKVMEDEGEDCLTVNVWAPRGGARAVREGGWPVVVWIHGGGFELGGSATYSGLPIVAHSIELGEPVVFVSMNYRLNAFGFLAGQEVLDAGEGAANLGLDDQRVALLWVQRYITSFNGDPSRVTIWGQSAGAISVGLHLVGPTASADPPLFHAAVLQSGAPIAVGSAVNGQVYYDAIVEGVGCSGSAQEPPEGNAAASLECLRQVDWREIKRAVATTPGVFDFAAPRLAAGTWIKESPWNVLERGQYAKIPLLVGNCDDEGTMFTLASFNITTSAAALEYIRQTFAPNASDEDVQRLRELYPTDPTLGAPFETGYLNQLSPQYKRLAAILGDIGFHSPRRHLLSVASETQDVWAYLYQRGKATPWLGAFHGSDLENEFFAPEVGATDFTLMDNILTFVNHHTPNHPSPASRPLSTEWPRWTNGSRSVLAFVDHPPGLPAMGVDVREERWREEGLDLLGQWAGRWPI